MKAQGRDSVRTNLAMASGQNYGPEKSLLLQHCGQVKLSSTTVRFLPFFRQRRRNIIDNIWIRQGSQIPSFPQATRCLHVRAHPYPCTNRAACGKEGFWVTRRIHGKVKKPHCSTLANKSLRQWTICYHETVSKVTYKHYHFTIHTA